MCKGSVARRLGTALLVVAFTFPAPALATELITSIDLNYTYTQTQLGENITDSATVSQQYMLEYRSAVTSIFELVSRVKVDLENGFDSKAADSSAIAPSLALGLVGTNASIDFSYDAGKSQTDAINESSAKEAYTNSALLSFQVRPLYFPEIKIDLERGRDYAEQDSESVGKRFFFQMKKDIEDLHLDFEFERSRDEESLPSNTLTDETAWSADVSYQSVLWWDVDVDLSYEIEEVYSESFRNDVFTNEEESYVHGIQAGFRKSLDLTPRLRSNIFYKYEFIQDLLQIKDDYGMSQSLGADASYTVFHWLEVRGAVKREAEEKVNLPPTEVEESLQDIFSLEFDARITDWLDVAGTADWEKNQEISIETGGSVDRDDSASYEIAVRHSWGDWWDLDVVGSTDYDYEDSWLVSKEGALKAAVSLSLIDDLDIDAVYDIERITEYESYEALAFDQSQLEQLRLNFSYFREFTSVLSIAISHGMGVSRGRDLDEVLNYLEVIEASEDTTLGFVLTDFIRDMQLKGTVTRVATDIKDDDEPLLVDISYQLSWEWVVRELELGAEFTYDDSGSTFDEATLKADVAWSSENIDISGEYQIDKVYSEETNENRQINLSMRVSF